MKRLNYPQFRTKRPSLQAKTPVNQSAVNVEALTAGVSGLGRVKQRSREGLEAARTELEEREKVAEELQALQIWLQVAHGLLSEMEQSSSTDDLQVGNFLPSYCK